MAPFTKAAKQVVAAKNSIAPSNSGIYLTFLVRSASDHTSANQTWTLVIRIAADSALASQLRRPSHWFLAVAKRASFSYYRLRLYEAALYFPYPTAITQLIRVSLFFGLSIAGFRIEAMTAAVVDARGS